jgi:hypothetical protein
MTRSILPTLKMLEKKCRVSCRTIPTDASVELLNTQSSLGSKKGSGKKQVYSIKSTRKLKFDEQNCLKLIGAIVPYIVSDIGRYH